MFLSEASFRSERRSKGAAQALAYFADMNSYTRLHDVNEGSKPRGLNEPKPTFKEKLKQQEMAQPRLQGARTLFDLNEHFVELSNAEEYKRSLGFMLLILGGLILCLPLLGLTSSLSNSPALSQRWILNASIGGGALFLLLCLLYFAWPHFFAPAFFTSLRARYRFNRTTRKVYVLRPRKYGGNAVLDWNRVQAHVNWRPPVAWTAEQLASSEAARLERVQSDGSDSNLVLYWPALDANDPERKGEDVLWVGPNGSGEPLWQYIRTYMEEGMDAVPRPSEREWLRKGFSNPAQHLNETVMHGSRVRDEIVGEGVSGGTAANFGLNVIWTPLHSLAERLCYWPTFPEEWNSDCGQKRRESGIGPEEPLRWQSKSSEN